MAASADPWQFSSSPLSARDCRVIAFTGEEAVGEGYVFDILLLASGVEARQSRDMQEALMRAPLLTLTGRGADGSQFSWNGAAQEVAYTFSSKAGAVYAIRMRPRSWKLTFSVHSHIFISLPLPKMLNKLLAEEGLHAGRDFADDLQGNYKVRPFTCRYNESAWDFLMRSLERVGAYTYIRQADDGDVLVLADGKSTPDSLAPGDTLDMRSKDGPEEAVYAFTRILAAASGKIGLRDYSSEKPGLVEGKAEATADAAWRRGEKKLFGTHDQFGEVDCFSKDFVTEDAKARADELAAAHLAAEMCKTDTARGRSTVPWLRAGCMFSLNDEKYQLLRVRHKFFMPRDELENKIAERARLENLIAGENGQQGYRNAFACRPTAEGLYVPERRTPRPVISGMVNVEIDASGSGNYAELDGKGRYKVKFPFAEKVFFADSDNPGDGNRSIPLRMVQAHAGTNSGIHFPLLKGVEVLVSFIHGDPDRPVIMGTLPNAANASPVVDTTRHTNVISTPGGHNITLNDTLGQEEIRIAAPGSRAVLRIY
jgi:type VI secretion system secreted protein VgrG